MSTTKTIQTKLSISGVSCPDCLAKIEKEVSNIDGIENCTMNIITKVLSYNIQTQKNSKNILPYIIKKIKSVEYDAIIKDLSTSESSDEIDDTESKRKTLLLTFIIGTILFISAILLHNFFIIKITFYIIAFLLLGYDVFIKAVRNIIHGKVFDENFLISIATLGAMCIGEYPEAVAVIFLYKIGMYLENKAVNKSRNSIKALMDIKADFANLKEGKSVKKVSPEKVKVGEEIIIKPGEKIPLDGVIIEGNSSVDTKTITGEPVPKSLKENDKIYSGYINGSGVLTVKVEKPFADSTVSKILELVQNAANKKSKTESFFTKFAKIYTPIVVIIAVFLAFIPPLLFPEYTFIDWIYRALIFLVISCPCAMVISIPLTFFGGIGAASRKGILIKGGNFIDALNNVSTVVFDKTGTLTKGEFELTSIIEKNDFTKDKILQYAVAAESFSNHPIAESIKRASNSDILNTKVTKYNEHAGLGISCKVDKDSVLCGNYRLMDENNIKYDREKSEIGTVVYLAINNVYAGALLISDSLKKDSVKAIQLLRNIGINKTVILSGDNYKTTEIIAEELKIDEVYAELLPEQKVEKLLKLKKGLNRNSNLVFVGDGINDAPVIRSADVGIAMGGLGSDAAIESADVVLMNDEPSAIPKAISIAKQTKKIAYQNIIFALTVKIAILGLATLGYATMWEAVFADVGVTVIAVLNSTRILISRN